MPLTMNVGVSSNDTLELIMLDSLEHQELSNYRNDPDEAHSMSSFKLESGGQNSPTNHLTNAPSPTLGNVSCASLSSNSNSGMTTLELHPNVILGISEDEDSSNGTERPHLCSMCNASYKTKTHLRRHMIIHTGSRPFPCQSCGKGFNRKEHLNKHMEAVHSTEKHRCPYCDRKISRLDHLKRHIKNMHSSSPKKSPKEKGAVLKVQLPNGLKQKAQLSFLSPNFSLGNTGQTIITPIPITNDVHQSDSEVKRESSTACVRESQAKTEFAKNDTPSMTIIPSNILGSGQGIATLAIQSTPTQKVLVHQRLPSGSNVNLSAVTNGLAGLANLSLSLGARTRESGSSGSGFGGLMGSERTAIFQLFTCGECDTTFQTEKDLLAHTTKSHKPQPYRCSDCPRAYTRREKLTEHIRSVHQGQKFGCEFCGKNLSRKDHVLRHIRSIHPEVYAASFAEIEEGNIMLDETGKLVRTNDASPPSPDKRRRNPTSATLNIPSIGDVGVLLRSVCHVCLKVFGTAYHLTRHMESCHNGDSRPFSCSACNKMFKRKDHLTKHTKSHCPKLKEEKSTPHTSLSSSNETKLKSSENESHQPKQSSKVENQDSSAETSQTTPELAHTQNSQDEQVENERNLRMLAEESMSSSDCTHMILQNLQVELGTGGGNHGGSTNTTLQGHHNNITSTPTISQSNDLHQKMSTQNEFSVAVIDSFMQGNVNVVVVDEEISSFLQQSSASHMTTTFPCGQCQKEFSARDLLIAHLQEHENDNAIQDAHDHRISDISFSDF